MRADFEELDAHGAHHEGKARHFALGFLEQRAMTSTEQPQVIGAATLHEAQIVGVIDDAGEVRVLVIYPHRHQVPALAHGAVESGIETDSSSKLFVDVHAAVDHAHNDNQVGLRDIRYHMVSDDDAAKPWSKLDRSRPIKGR